MVKVQRLKNGIYLCSIPVKIVKDYSIRKGMVLSFEVLDDNHFLITVRREQKNNEEEGLGFEV